jgi:ADP-dependent phosphofructokinase/glucokinase
MNRITISKRVCTQETTSAWLASVLQFAFDIEFFAPFKAFQLKMKEVRYTVYRKLLTIVASILMGCESTKDINEILSSETLAANMLEMERFPDQSQINLVLRRMDEGSIDQLRSIYHQLFMNNSHSIFSDETVVIDFDQSGLVANAKSYEFAEKGYFPHKRGKTGYQVSATLPESTQKWLNSTWIQAMYTVRNVLRIYDHLLP